MVQKMLRLKMSEESNLLSFVSKFFSNAIQVEGIRSLLMNMEYHAMVYIVES